MRVLAGKNPQRTSNVFMFALSALACIVLYYCAGLASFWVDELCTVSSVRNALSFSDTVKHYATKDVQSPLFPFIAYFWYRIVPHTERALRALGIIFALSGCIVIGVIGRKLYGVRFGIFAFLFAVSNHSVLVNGAIDFRPYSLVLLVASLNYWCYLNRLKNESWPHIILYGVTMGLMPYTHYVSVLFCFGLFIADCVLIAKRSAGIRVIASYIIGALIFSPWAYVLLPSLSRNFSSFWPEVPNLISILKLWKYLVSARYMFTIGLFCIAWHLFRHYKEYGKFSPESCFLNAGIFASVFMVAVVYVYSRYINPGGSFFVGRYFFPVMPFVSFTAAYGADFIYTRLCTPRKELIFAVVFVLMLSEGFYMAAKQDMHSEPYREAARFIHEYESGHTVGKSAILSAESRLAHNGFDEMYLAHYPDMKVLPSFCPNAQDDENVLENLQRHRYDRIYFCHIHTVPDKQKYFSTILQWLNENYDFGKEIEDCKLHVLNLRK